MYKTIVTIYYTFNNRAVSKNPWTQVKIQHIFIKINNSYIDSSIYR